MQKKKSSKVHRSTIHYKATLLCMCVFVVTAEIIRQDEDAWECQCVVKVYCTKYYVTL